MPTSDNRSKYTRHKRSNLFLLRVWCDDDDYDHDRDRDPDPKADFNENGTENKRSGPKWHGRVQRTVSGEEHDFEDKETLIEVLERMLCKDRPDYGDSNCNCNCNSNGPSPTKISRSGAALDGGGNTGGNDAREGTGN